MVREQVIQEVQHGLCTFHIMQNADNTEVETKAEVCQIFNIMTEYLSDKYLGLPAMIGVDKVNCFKHLIERIQKMVNGWKERTLSYGGKEALIKAVAQAIPTYAMSVFKFPKKNCKGITDAMSQYCWGDEENHKRMHWFTWWKMCVPKERGGMGFRDIHSFNMAMLAKQCWRLIENYDSLCARVLRARYYPSGDILNCELKKGSSFVWQSIWAGIQTFKKDAFGELKMVQR